MYHSFIEFLSSELLSYTHLNVVCVPSILRFYFLLSQFIELPFYFSSFISKASSSLLHTAVYAFWTGKQISFFSGSPVCLAGLLFLLVLSGETSRNLRVINTGSG